MEDKWLGPEKRRKILKEVKRFLHVLYASDLFFTIPESSAGWYR